MISRWRSRWLRVDAGQTGSRRCFCQARAAADRGGSAATALALLFTCQTANATRPGALYFGRRAAPFPLFPSPSRTREMERREAPGCSATPRRTWRGPPRAAVTARAPPIKPRGCGASRRSIRIAGPGPRSSRAVGEAAGLAQTSANLLRESGHPDTCSRYVLFALIVKPEFEGHCSTAGYAGFASLTSRHRGGRPRWQPPCPGSHR